LGAAVALAEGVGGVDLGEVVGEAVKRRVAPEAVELVLGGHPACGGVVEVLGVAEHEAKPRRVRGLGAREDRG
jgi:hypothetical protein